MKEGELSRPQQKMLQVHNKNQHATSLRPFLRDNVHFQHLSTVNSAQNAYTEERWGGF